MAKAAVHDEIYRELDHGCKIVQLTLYKHQVSGHHVFLMYDENKLLKHLNEDEQYIYEGFPEYLTKFIPKFYGIVKVVCHKAEDGEILCFALPKDCSYLKDNDRFQNWLTGMQLIKNQSFTNVFTTIEDDKEDLKIKERVMKQLQRSIEDKKSEKFMLLEDVSRKFKFPCAIDLKMGTRGFGDREGTEKQKRKQRKADSTTALSLGVRMSGMQVYQPCSEEYFTVNKLEGRKFKDEDFVKALKRFIYNGSHHRVELLGPYIERLEKLLYNIEKADCFRFYCSSLLLMYDGDTSMKSPHVEVRMIDFAHCVLKHDELNTHKGPDKGYIKGLQNTIDIFKNIRNSFEKPSPR